MSWPTITTLATSVKVLPQLVHRYNSKKAALLGIFHLCLARTVRPNIFGSLSTDLQVYLIFGFPRSLPEYGHLLDIICFLAGANLVRFAWIYLCEGPTPSRVLPYEPRHGSTLALAYSRLTPRTYEHLFDISIPPPNRGTQAIVTFVNAICLAFRLQSVHMLPHHATMPPNLPWRHRVATRALYAICHPL